ncbi:MAG TPA: hypothetical protein VFU23_04290 [Gemmatimonadales bacterium]|nr:hypothetical protein [Gemmatimonadales bacterium]
MLPLPDTTVATRKRIARKYKLAQLPDPRRYLHIRCGDDILDTLDAAGVPGDKIRWADVLTEGPLHPHASDADRQRERAAYISGRFLMPMTEVYREMKGADWRVDQCGLYHETVLWFEADVFDQTILVYLLQRLRPHARDTRISLICIGEFPGVERFIGLGQLGAVELAGLLPTRRPVTARQFELARETWTALSAPSPRDLIRLAASRSRALPFLPAAIGRYLAEYPSTSNGLSRTAQLALEEIAGGASTSLAAFSRVQDRERRPFMGDWMFYALLRELAAGVNPLLAGTHPRLSRLPNREFPEREIWLTEQGRRVLEGKADWCALCGVARQIGGVTLLGPHPRWRWDPAQERLVERRRK